MLRTVAHITIAVLLALTGCAPDITDTDFYSRHPENPIGGDEFVTVGQADIDGTSVKLLASDDLHIGPNTIQAEIRRGSTQITTGSVSVSAKWITASRDLESPRGSSSATTANDDDRFELTVYFLEPEDGESGSWILDLDVSAGGSSGQARIEVTVSPDIWVQFVEGTGESDSYYVQWIDPVRPETGESDLDLALYRLTDDGFEPIADATMNLYPYMDMGGGEGHSTPFEPPVHTGSGVYHGMVNYVMAGGWDLTVYIDRAGRSDTVVFKGFTVH